MLGRCLVDSKQLEQDKAALRQSKRSRPEENSRRLRN
jgi:hypothetical protein